MAAKTSFRIGRVRAHQRGRVWYLAYVEQGIRRQPRVGTDPHAARRMAAEINAQLEVGTPSALGFQPIAIAELRQRWLDHHEHVRRSSVSTIKRYRTATQHLIEFADDVGPARHVGDFGSQNAEAFVRYLRSKKVAPNGHHNAAKRPLRDAGIKFILETCGSLFNYAARNRHLPPYADNPFNVIEIHRMPVEDARPVVALTSEEEEKFLQACDTWQFPIFLMLLLTGARPGELVHLLLPDDLDLDAGWLRIRNKSALGWQVKTRSERDIPLVPVLRRTIQAHLGTRRTGPLFVQRRCMHGYAPPLLACSSADLRRELSRRVAREETSSGALVPRARRLRIAQQVWRDMGALKEDWVRTEFMRLTKTIGLAEVTAPKTLRHSFATMLQDGNVDPLIRNELMGHSPGAVGLSGISLRMTAVYTHTRPEIKRQQLEGALLQRGSVGLAQAWLEARDKKSTP